MTNRYVAMVLTILALNTNAGAHEGHDHDSPATVRASNPNGMIRSLEKVYVEVVPKNQNISIYLFDKEKFDKADPNSKKPPLPVINFKVSAEAKLPRKSKSEVMKLISKGDYFEGTFDAKGAHRYILVLTVIDLGVGHPDKLEFTIEPKR